MANLSANTLFHFTPREFLLDKFENGFVPRYNTEFDPELDPGYFNSSYNLREVNLSTNEQKDLSHELYHATYIAMVCFCDIPLSSLAHHMGVYSGYGVGLRKEWGIESGLNPVMYINGKSNFFKTFSGLLNIMGFNSVLLKEFFLDKDKLEKIKTEGLHMFVGPVQTHLLHWNSIHENIVKQLKPYVCGGKYRGRFENYSYYDEKEWRYVPWMAPNDPVRPVIMKNLTKLEIDELNKSIKTHSLKFKPKDVKYIIIENDDDVDFLAEGLLKIKDKTGIYSEEDINLLLTKIVTKKQISEDF